MFGHSAFSKRFLGADHSEEGGGQGGEGTLPSGPQDTHIQGGLGAFPLKNILKFGCSKVPFGAVWGDLKRQSCISFAQLYLPSPTLFTIRQRDLFSVCCQFCILVLLFNSNSSSFTSNLCGFPNGVFIRICLTRRGSSPLTRTFTCKRVFLEKIMCVWMVS